MQKKIDKIKSMEGAKLQCHKCTIKMSSLKDRWIGFDRKIHLCVAYKRIRLQIVKILPEALKAKSGGVHNVAVLPSCPDHEWCLASTSWSSQASPPPSPPSPPSSPPPSPPPSTTTSLPSTTSQQPADAQLNTKVRTLENVSTMLWVPELIPEEVRVQKTKGLSTCVHQW